jgi:hypothetical protein
MQKKIIFSEKEGFWNDNDGWSFCPSCATEYEDPVDTKASFIGINDAIYVNPSHYSHVDYDGAREIFFESLGQYNGNQIAVLLTDISGTDFSYEGDSFWLVGGRTFDDDNIQSFIGEDADIDDKKMLDLLNQHSNGKFYTDSDGGFYRHEPTSL